MHEGNDLSGARRRLTGLTAGAAVLASLRDSSSSSSPSASSNLLTDSGNVGDSLDSNSPLLLSSGESKGSDAEDLRTSSPVESVADGSDGSDGSSDSNDTRAPTEATALIPTLFRHCYQLRDIHCSSLTVRLKFMTFNSRA